MERKELKNTPTTLEKVNKLKEALSPPQLRLLSSGLESITESLEHMSGNTEQELKKLEGLKELINSALSQK